MPKTIIISDQTDSRLKALARPLEDTHDSVISRLLESFEKHRAEPESMLVRKDRVFDPFSHPSLTFTKVTFASFDGQILRKPNWNALLDLALRIARKRGGSTEFVRKYANVNLVEGEKSDEGYHYLADVGFSVQGQDANDAWRVVAQLARRLSLAAEVQFFWRHKDGAAHPGDNGVFRLAGVTS